MAIVLSYSSGVPTVKVGRIAGQFAKPRSSDTEVIGDLEIPSFRGHIVHDIAPTEAARLPHPDRLLPSYHPSPSPLHLLLPFVSVCFSYLSLLPPFTLLFLSSPPLSPPPLLHSLLFS